MTDARCEPTEALRGVDGWHVVWPRREDILGYLIPRAWFWNAEHQEWRETPRRMTAWGDSMIAGYRYGGPAPNQSSAPVPSPEAVRVLVEAGRLIGEAHDDRDIEPATGVGHMALGALRAALAAFKEPTP